MKKIAIILLNAHGQQTAERVKTLLPDVKIYGLEKRTVGADETFTRTAETLQQLAADGVTIIGLCAAGILIRALAPILSDKRTEPPVVALADDGSVAVPLLGGLSGANELAGKIAELFDGVAAITASGSRRFGVQLEAPTDGYILANLEAAKKITSDILAGATVKLDGENLWLSRSTLPIDENGTIVIKTSPYNAPPPKDGLLFHPKCVSVAITAPHQQAVSNITEALGEKNIAPAAIGVILLPEGSAPPESLVEFSHKINAALRYEAPDAPIFDGPTPVTLELARGIINAENLGRAHGHLTVVGLGPGDAGSLSGDVKDALFQADDLVGYSTYLNLVPPLRAEQKRHASQNRVEINRAQEALDLAARGKRVAVVSSGDPGIFAMASAVMEAYEAEPQRWPGIDIEILPGISAMQTAAARFGAPLGHDFCAISLSDIRKPWDIIKKRLIAAAEADFILALYNPASKERRTQISEAISLLSEHRAGTTPVLIGQDLGRTGERTHVTRLQELDCAQINMRSIIIIGSSQTRVFSSPSGKIFSYSPRTHGRE